MIKQTILSVFRNKLRAALTISGIAVGVTAVVLVSAVGEIGKNEISATMAGMGMDNLVVTAQENGYSVLTEENLSEIKVQNGVTNAMPLMNLITEGEILKTTSQVMIWGINEDAKSVIDLNVLHGRLINKGDVKTGNKVCMIDEKLAIESYQRSNIIGKEIELNFGIKNETFTIVGIVKSGVSALQNMLGGFVPDFVYVPFTVMQETLGSENFDQITVKVADSDTGDKVAGVIKQELSSDYAQAGVAVENLLKQKDNMNSILTTATIALSAVAGISLIVSGTSIMTVMLVSVSERTREIGIKKSIGASNKTIMSEFLLEAVIITLTGSVIGVLAGILLSLAASLIIGVTFAVNIPMCIAAIVFSVIIGGVFGVYPAMKASKLKPVEALRHE
ncbi:MAG: ABC transporter permease [Ruminococcus sp.]|jgi:putative ABC transport system permease protein|nr:ABC transporter permease [Ruminococcus sp.]